MGNKKDMKAYVRYDGMGKIVPSSVILAKKMPKVGKWVEIDAYECCQPTPTTHTSICVSGFLENAEFNGTYAYLNLTGGRPHYQKGGNYDVYWDGSKWVIGDVAYSENNVANPTLVTIWMELPGDGAISVTSGVCTTSTTTTIPATTTTTTIAPTTTTTTTEEPTTTTTTTIEGG